MSLEWSLPWQSGRRWTRSSRGWRRRRNIPTQGETLFVDLERQQVQRGFIPRAVAEKLLGGRGVNMYLLWNLLDASLEPLHPDIPLIFGTGTLTSLVPSRFARKRHLVVARVESPDGLQRRRLLPLVHEAGTGSTTSSSTAALPRGRCCGSATGRSQFVDASPVRGARQHRPARERSPRTRGDVEGKDFGLAAITSAGENLVLCSGIMAGPKAIFARGGPGAKMGSLQPEGGPRGRAQRADSRRSVPTRRATATSRSSCSGRPS